MEKFWSRPSSKDLIRIHKDGAKPYICEGRIYCPYKKKSKDCPSGIRSRRGEFFLIDGKPKELFRCYNAEIANLEKYTDFIPVKMLEENN